MPASTPAPTTPTGSTPALGGALGAQPAPQGLAQTQQPAQQMPDAKKHLHHEIMFVKKQEQDTEADIIIFLGSRDEFQ